VIIRTKPRAGFINSDQLEGALVYVPDLTVDDGQREPIGFLSFPERPEREPYTPRWPAPRKLKRRIK
jgi:hypothetical protein